jgi:hypothetical protein
MPDDLADPVVTAACFSCCRRAMGEAFTRHSLRPLSIMRVCLMQNPDAIRAAGTRSSASLLFDNFGFGTLVSGHLDVFRIALFRRLLFNERAALPCQRDADKKCMVRREAQ